jgi:hypothetical protein
VGVLQESTTSYPRRSGSRPGICHGLVPYCVENAGPSFDTCLWARGTTKSISVTDSPIASGDLLPRSKSQLKAQQNQLHEIKNRRAAHATSGAGMQRPNTPDTHDDAPSSQCPLVSTATEHACQSALRQYRRRIGFGSRNNILFSRRWRNIRPARPTHNCPPSPYPTPRPGGRDS